MTAETKKEQDLLRRLVESREAVRQKYKILKENQSHMERALGETFKPIVEPLDKLVSLSEKRIQPTETSSDQDVKSESSPSSLETKHEQLAESYLQMEEKDYDRLFGVQWKNDKYLMGNTEVSFKDNLFHVNGEDFPATKGLMELLFKKEPDRETISRKDWRNYHDVLESTNVHKIDCDADGEFRWQKSRKFQNFIGPLFERETSFTGRGFSLPRYKVARLDSIKEYVYFDDPNELVDRLRLLVAERSAGNNNHTIMRFIPS